MESVLKLQIKQNENCCKLKIDVVIGVRGLGLDFQSGQVKRRVATLAAYFGMVALKISALFFGDVIG